MHGGRGLDLEFGFLPTQPQSKTGGLCDSRLEAGESWVRGEAILILYSLLETLRSRFRNRLRNLGRMRLLIDKGAVIVDLSYLSGAPTYFRYRTICSEAWFTD